jgi:osmotically-inducible protein OsmY
MTGISKAILVDKEERSFNNYVEDTIILAQLKNKYFSTNENIFFQVSVEVIEGRVLLTGVVEPFVVCSHFTCSLVFSVMLISKTRF